MRGNVGMPPTIGHAIIRKCDVKKNLKNRLLVGVRLMTTLPTLKMEGTLTVEKKLLLTCFNNVRYTEIYDYAYIYDSNIMKIIILLFYLNVVAILARG